MLTLYWSCFRRGSRGRIKDEGERNEGRATTQAIKIGVGSCEGKKRVHLLLCSVRMPVFPRLCLYPCYDYLLKRMWLFQCGYSCVFISACVSIRMCLQAGISLSCASTVFLFVAACLTSVPLPLPLWRRFSSLFITSLSLYRLFSTLDAFTLFPPREKPP